MEGRPIGDDEPIDPAATTIRTAVLVAPPEMDAVMHVHTQPSIAISAVKGGLESLPGCDGLLYSAGYHDFEDIATDGEDAPTSPVTSARTILR